MIGQSHLIVMSMVTEQRVADFHAEAERHRLARLAPPVADRRQARPDLAAVVAVITVLALLLAATFTVGAA